MNPEGRKVAVINQFEQMIDGFFRPDHDGSWMLLSPLFGRHPLPPCRAWDDLSILYF